MNLANAAVNTQENWQTVCQAQDLVADSGVVVWLDGAQVALFYLPGQASRCTRWTTATHAPVPISSVVGWWAVCKVSWWWQRRSTSSTSAC